MMTFIPSDSRGHVNAGWLDARHSFSFGEYYDPDRMGFGPLRVINEDRIAGGGGFPMHPHANMEIITVVLEGALAHKDSLGNGSAIRPGDVQMMRAGTGIRHSEYNPSMDEGVHLLQIWLMPHTANAEPAYQQARFAVLDPAQTAPAGWHPLVAPIGSGGGSGNGGQGLEILQDARLSAARLKAGDTPLPLAPEAGRRYWLQVMRGAVTVNLDGETQTVAAGDALALENETRRADIVSASADGEAWVLLFDLGR